jgi:glycosyltransferase involved in cell wall biosynthesis
VSGLKVPKVSIVVTCYNNRNYIADTIRSVARQTLSGFDCVIVDDASTDDSRDVVRRVLGDLNDPRFRLIELENNRGQTGATREGLKHVEAPFVCFLDADDLWNERFLERHLASHLNESFAAGFTACNARLIDRDGAVVAGGVYWFGQDRGKSERDLDRAKLDGARVPDVDSADGISWQSRTSFSLYTKRSLDWVWVSTSSMMFRRALVDLAFPPEDEAFRLHMDFYLVLMAQMIAGSLLIDDPLYSYRLHGRNLAASNPVLGGRLHLASRDLSATYGEMLDRMLASMLRDSPKLTAAMGEDQYGQMLAAMTEAHAPPRQGWRFWGGRTRT